MSGRIRFECDFPPACVCLILLLPRLIILCMEFDACVQETVLQGRKLAYPELQVDSMYRLKSSFEIFVNSLLSTRSCFGKAGSLGSSLSAVLGGKHLKSYESKTSETQFDGSTNACACSISINQSC